MFAGPIPKAPKHGRIKERYRPVPSAREKGYHRWLMDNNPCSCGCGGVSGVVHHVLARHPLKRWRRDHEMVVPMTGDCHVRLHMTDPREQHEFAGMADRAAALRDAGYAEGLL